MLEDKDIIEILNKNKGLQVVTLEKSPDVTALWSALTNDIFKMSEWTWSSSPLVLFKDNDSLELVICDLCGQDMPEENPGEYAGFSICYDCINDVAQCVVCQNIVYDHELRDGVCSDCIDEILNDEGSYTEYNNKRL